MADASALRGGDDLRIAVVGAGMMGGDHIERISRRISGARVAAIVEPDAGRGQAAAANAPGAVVRADIRDALDRDRLDAVLIATPGPFHEQVMLPSLEAGLAILCEKPLTPDSESSLRILEAEQRLVAPRIQVGFMRRFDAEYVALRDLIASGELGALLLMHCAHRNPSTAPGYTESMLITDSVVHELDAVPWLAGDRIAAISVVKPRRNSLAPAGLDEPQLVLIELASGVIATVEINVNVRFGYQVTTEAVFEHGIAETGRTSGLTQWKDGRWGGAEHVTFKTRFGAAFDTEIQRWVDAVRRGTIDGATAWDGYLAAAACEAGVAAQRTGRRVEVNAIGRPDFYTPATTGRSR
jgi:myo-inositol 2-dehydrogenase / D-chiro-inositol 1-dehydrogenase